MTWAKLDDQFPVNVKVSALKDNEFRLHVTAICHCSAQLTDGFVAKHVPGVLPNVPRTRALKRAINKLVEIGLWEEVDDGWVIHDYLDWNPSAAQAKAKKAARAAAGRRGGQAKRRHGGEQNGSNCFGDASAELDTSDKQNGTPSPSPSPGDPPGGGSDARDGAPPPTTLHDSDRESACPTSLELPELAKSELAARLGVTAEDVAAGEHEFVTYWTVGGGAGRRKTHWLSALRRDLCEKHRRKQLAGMGGSSGATQEVEQCPY